MIFEPDGYTIHQALICIMIIIYIYEQNGVHEQLTIHFPKVMSKYNTFAVCIRKSVDFLIIHAV